MEGEKFKIERETFTFDLVPATVDDVQDILALNKKLFEYENSQGFDDNLDTDWPETEEAVNEVSERVTSEDSCGFVVKCEGKTVAYLVGLILEEETGRADSRYAELEHMFTDETFRGKGLGEKLVESFKQWAKDHGIKKLSVNVSFLNKDAIRFYEKVGLIPSDLRLTMSLES